MVQSLAAHPAARQPLFSGYQISAQRVRRRAEGRQASGRAGDVMRVRLDLEAQSDMTWVVVNDPVPAGASVLGTGPRARLADPGRGREEAGLGVARFRGAQVRFVPRLLPLRAEGQVDARVQRAAEQPRRVPAAAERGWRRCMLRRCSGRCRTPRSWSCREHVFEPRRTRRTRRKDNLNAATCVAVHVR